MPRDVGPWDEEASCGIGSVCDMCRFVSRHMHEHATLCHLSEMRVWHTAPKAISKLAIKARLNKLSATLSLGWESGYQNISGCWGTKHLLGGRKLRFFLTTRLCLFGAQTKCNQQNASLSSLSLGSALVRTQCTHVLGKPRTCLLHVCRMSRCHGSACDQAHGLALHDHRTCGQQHTRWRYSFI